MSKKCMVNLDGQTNAMKEELLTIDGWNFSFQTRVMIRAQYIKAVKDGQLVPKHVTVGKANESISEQQ